MSVANFTATSALTDDELQAAELRARVLLSDTLPFSDQAWAYAVRRTIRRQRETMLGVMADRGLRQL